MVRTYTRKYTNSRNGKSFLPYQNYSAENLQVAIESVKEGRMSLTDAADTFGVPKSTLSRKTRNINCTQETAGHPTLFTPEEEKVFIKFVLIVGEWGFPFDTTDLRVFAKKYLDRLGKNVYNLKDNMPGYDWARNFLQRHRLQISNRKSAHISSDRARFRSDDIDAFFENYVNTVEGVPAAHIINYDETNLTDDPGNKKYIYKRGCKYPERIINSSKTAISLMFSGTASGHLLPIYVVYKSENLWDTWMEGGPEGTRYNRSKSGWFDSTCFEDWFHTIIVPYFRNKPGRKVLIGDNLSSHFSESVIKTCETLNIAFVCLPPKTTHLLQPLDVAFFAPLKVYWRDILTKWKITEGRHHKTLIKSAFPKLLKKLKNKLIENDAESRNLIAGFNKSGLYPVDLNRPKSRLPQSHVPRSEEEIETSSTSVIKDMLMELRCPDEPTGMRRKKRFVVEPGKSVSSDDLVQNQSKTSARLKVSGKRKELKKSTSNILSDPFIDSVPGPSGLHQIRSNKNHDSDNSDDQIASVLMPKSKLTSYKGMGKGIGKKTKPCKILINKKQQSENVTETALNDTLVNSGSLLQSSLQNPESLKNLCIRWVNTHLIQNNELSGQRSFIQNLYETKNYEANVPFIGELPECLLNSRPTTRSKPIITSEVIFEAGSSQNIRNRKKINAILQKENVEITQFALNMKLNIENKEQVTEKRKVVEEITQESKELKEIIDNVKPKKKIKSETATKVKKRTQKHISRKQKWRRSSSDSSSSEIIMCMADSDDSEYETMDDLITEFYEEEQENIEPSIPFGFSEIEFFTEDNNTLKIDSWILAKFATKKSVKHFVGKIILIKNNIPDVKFVRKVKESKFNRGSVFTYPTVDDICTMRHLDDIVLVLPEPNISRRGQIIFDIDLSNYNVQ